MEPVNENEELQDLGEPVIIKKRKWLLVPIIVLSMIVAVLAVYIGLCAYASSLNTFFPNYYICGVDVGNLTADAAQRKLESELPTTVITLTSEGHALTTCTVADLGYATEDLSTFVRSCLYEARSQTSVMEKGLQYLRAFKGEISQSSTPLPRDELVFEGAPHRLMEALQTSEETGSYTVTEDGKLLVTVGQGRSAIDEPVLRARLEEAVERPNGARSVELPYGANKTEAITAQKLHDALHRDMQNAAYDEATGTMTPEQIGLDFDVAEAQAKLDQAQPGETVEIQMTYLYPEVTVQDLEKVLSQNALKQDPTKVAPQAPKSPTKTTATKPQATTTPEPVEPTITEVYEPDTQIIVVLPESMG